MPGVRRRVFDPGDEVGAAPDGEQPMTEQEARDLRKLASRIGALERDVATLARDTQPMDQLQTDDAAPVNRDARWYCVKCGYLLGFYDVADDVLRTRYKEHIVFVRCGDGGFVQVVCRGCSHVNTATGESAPSDDAGDAG